MRNRMILVLGMVFTITLVGCGEKKSEEALLEACSNLTYAEAADKIMENSIEDESVKSSLISMGENSNRITKAINKLEAGEQVTIAYLGGSITEGYKVSNKESYAYKTTEKIKETFQNQNINMINAGLSGTSSTIGLLRVDKDVLSSNPDIIIIEFAVNDGQDVISKVAYESLIKKCLLSDSEPAIILLFTVLENGYNCEDQMREVGEAYGLPMISVNSSIESQITKGTLNWSDYALDEAHPTNNGHTMISQYINYYFTCAKTIINVGFIGESKEYNDITVNGTDFYPLTFYNASNFEPESLEGFAVGNSNIDHFPNGWINTRKSIDSMKFKMTGKDLFILYKEDNDDSLGTIEVYCDGEIIKEISGNSESGWNNPQVKLVLNLESVGEHEIEIKMTKDTLEKNFHLLGFGTTGEMEGSFVQSEREEEEAKIPYTQRAIINGGNTFRLEDVYKRALDGEEITIGYIGGSITQGAGSNAEENSYVGLISKWWIDTFPDAKFTFINAGIGATTSQFGCARVEEDLLSYEPDFVIVEFSVNDESNIIHKDSYESLLRLLITDKKKPAVMVLNAVQFDTGYNVQEMHNNIAKHYDIPVISMKDSIYNEIELGRIAASDISSDMLHPNNKGHKYMAEIVSYYMDKVLNKEYTNSEKYLIPEATRDLVGINSKIYDSRNTSASLDNFTKDITMQSDVSDVFKNGWVATEEDSSIIFFVSGSRISLQYRKTNLMAAPKGIVIIDGDEENAIEIDGNYPDGWGDWLYLHTVYEGEAIEHTVEIRLTKGGKNEFYLASIITTE